MDPIVRIIHDAGTRAYVDRRRAEGKSSREVLRTFSRYLARSLVTRCLAPESRLIKRYRRFGSLAGKGKIPWCGGSADSPYDPLQGFQQQDRR